MGYTIIGGNDMRFVLMRYKKYVINNTWGYFDPDEPTRPWNNHNVLDELIEEYGKDVLWIYEV